MKVLSAIIAGMGFGFMAILIIVLCLAASLAICFGLGCLIIWLLSLVVSSIVFSYKLAFVVGCILWLLHLFIG